jgi:DNA-binding NarL/FixJ family response regulator
MSDRLLKILLVDQDPIFRIGLRVSLEEVPMVQVTSEAQTDIEALEILAELAQKDPFQVNLVVLELSTSNLGLQLCQQLKIQYPNLPILLLSSIQDQGMLLAAKNAGVDGYCPKGRSVSELVSVMQEVADGRSYWFEEAEFKIPTSNLPTKSVQTSLTRIVNNLRLSGIGYINPNLAQVTANLKVPGLPLLEQVFLAGKRRELLAARWLLNHLLTSTNQNSDDEQTTPNSGIRKIDSLKTVNYPPLLSPRALQSALFASCVNKIQNPLQNVTDTPLEIDILRVEKKRELLYLILRKIAEALDDLRTSEITYQLSEIVGTILFDIWQASTREFFGKFSRVRVIDRDIEIVTLLMQDAESIKTEILNKIPLVIDLFAYLLFQTDLKIDNASYSAGSFEANEQGSMLLENLLIQIANGVVQPLLNQLADVETIKQNYYDSQLVSTREIEKFRNNLSWKYRLKNYVQEAQEIFESRYELFVFAPRGIAKTSIYAPRREELAQLSGIPLFVTLVLEFRDAIAPRMRSLLSFFGNGVVFVLTQVIGKGLGLIVRGILQGIGNVSLLEKKNKNL